MTRRGIRIAVTAIGLVCLLIGADGTPALAECTFALQGAGRVSAILDGRTFRLDDGHEVRLAGIELPDDSASRSADNLTSLIDGRQITLHGADDRPDRYGRQSAFVFLKDAGVSIQSELLGRGDALVSASATEAACSTTLLAAEADARMARRGIWTGSSALKNAETPADILTGLGRFAVVEGNVSSARLAGATFYVNFGRRWTQDFAVTISRRIMPSFEAAGIDLKSLKGKRIRVRGWVERRGGPRIEASHPGQIELITATSGVLKDDLAATTSVLRDEGK